jgi:hypothetical protein
MKYVDSNVYSLIPCRQGGYKYKAQTDRICATVSDQIIEMLMVFTSCRSPVLNNEERNEKGRNDCRQAGNKQKHELN